MGVLFCRSRPSNSSLACFITAPFRTSRGHRTRTRTATAGTDQIPSSKYPGIISSIRALSGTTGPLPKGYTQVKNGRL
jgi:hypothetical protein